MRAALRNLTSIVALLVVASAAEGQGRTVFALDVSHWSGNIDASDVACWKSSGVEHLVPGTQVEGITRQQLETAVAGGISVDAYVVLYWDQNIPSQVQRAVDIIRGFPVGRLWLDIEVYPGGRSVAQLENLIQQAVDACGSTPCGIYTGKWWWDAYMKGSTRFSQLPLWYAYYDNVASLDTWSYQKFGGWPFSTGKQYGYGYLCGVNVDFNMMRVEPPVGGEPPQTPTGLYPPAGIVVTSSSVTLAVTAVANATSYEFHIQYFDGAVWQEYFTYRPSKNSQTLWPQFADTRYRFQVRAGNAYGWSAWSGFSTFDFGNVGGPPTAPTLLSPADGAVVTTSSVTLAVQAVEDAIRYEFEIGYWNGTAWQTYFTYRPTGSSQTFWPAFTNTAYRWRTRAENVYGLGDWSDFRHFDFGSVPRLPPAPVATAPPDGAVVSSGSVTLEVGSVSGASSYEFEIGYSSGSEWLYYYTYRPTTNRPTFWPAYANTAYRWRSRARNGYGLGPWSDWRHFDFGVVARPPSAPAGLTPANGAQVTTSSVTLRVDALSGVSRYQFEIYYWDGTVWKYYYTYTSTTNAQTFWPTRKNTFYSFRARAENAHGFGDWSDTSNFAFGTVTPPPAPSSGWAFPVGSADTASGWYVSLGLGESWYSSPLGRWFRGHLGEDWFRSSGSSLGETVYAAAAGEVTTVLQNCGNYVDVVILKHPVEGQSEPVYSFYGHIEADSSVRVGDQVARRQRLGVIGNPVDFVPHLHFEIKNETALKNAPFSGCSNVSKGIYISAGYSGLSNDYAGGTFYDPTDATAGNRYFHPTRFIQDRP